MKKIILLASLVFIVFQAFYWKDTVKDLIDNNDPPQTPVITGKKEGKNNVDIQTAEGKFRITWESVPDLKKLNLYSNLDKKQSARKLYKEKGCKVLVSGGFYSKEDSHIGLFAAEGKTVSSYEKNKTFNGTVLMSLQDNFTISTDTPSQNLRFGLQSGPVLAKSGEYQKFDIKNDSQERRVVVATEENGEVIFLVVYDPESAFRGPNLAWLPEVVSMFGQKVGKKFTNALNLDGGTASAFVADDVSLGELSPIGSYFCF